MTVQVGDAEAVDVELAVPDELREQLQALACRRVASDGPGRSRPGRAGGNGAAGPGSMPLPAYVVSRADQVGGSGAR